MAENERENIDWETLRHLYIFVFSMFIVVSNIVNIWFIVAILKSKELRSRYKNQILCNIMFANLSETLVIMPIAFAWYVDQMWFKLDIHTCNVISVLHHLERIQDFVGNWSIFTIVLSFFAKNYEFGQRFTLSSRYMMIGRIATLVLPWLFAVIFISVMSFHNRFQILDLCLMYDVHATTVFWILCNVVPLGLAILILCTVVGLRVKLPATTRESNASLEGRSPSHNDNLWPYVCLLTIATLSDIIPIIDNVSDYKTRTVVAIVGEALIKSRVLTITFACLMFQDLRSCVRKSIPCLRYDARDDQIALTSTSQNELS